jgi:hypothetical protein
MMDRVVLEADWRWNFDRHRPDLYGQPHRLQGRHDLTIEIGDGSWHELHGANFPIAGADDQVVVDEIELERERSSAVRERACGEASSRDLKGDSPGVVERRGLSQRHLPYHLQPHVKGLVGVFPEVEPQVGPEFVHFKSSTRRIFLFP